MFDNKKMTNIDMLKRGLFLDSYNILIEWGIAQKEFLKEIKLLNASKNNESKVTIYRVQSRILNSQGSFIISFIFIKEKMKTIYIEKPNINLSTEEYFYKMQCFLVSRLGQPNYPYILQNLFSDKDDHIYGWKIGDIKIKHQLFDCKLRTTLEIIM